MRILIAVLLLSVFVNKTLFAHGECCLPKSLTEAAVSGVTKADNFGLSLQYEYTNMKTIRDGSDKISHNSVLDQVAAGWPSQPSETKTFSIPTRMIMQRYTLVGAYSVTKKLQCLVSVPYVINDMNMRTLVRGSGGTNHQHAYSDKRQNRSSATANGAGESDMRMDMRMNTIEDIGDLTLMGLYTLLSDETARTNEKLALGIGLKTPTGPNDEKIEDTDYFVHAVMQPGTGSWDPLFLINYTRTFYPIVCQTNLFYQMSTEGDEGYEFGDKISWDLIGRYQVSDYVKPGIEFNGLYTARDKDHDDNYSRPETSLLDDTGNTGITSLSVTPSVSVMIPNTGCSVDLKFQKPVYQNAGGTQQVVDWRSLISVVWVF